MRRVSRHRQARRYFHTDIGVNGRIDTLQAAILLGKWPNFAEGRILQLLSYDLIFTSYEIIKIRYLHCMV